MYATVAHVWVFDAHGKPRSTLNITGKGHLTILPGIGSQARAEAAKTIGKKRGIEIKVRVISPRQ